MSTEVLSDTDQAILAIEGEGFPGLGHKLNAIRERTGLSHTAYCARLNTLIDTEAALTVAPVVVNRLRRLRTRGRAGIRTTR